MFSKNKKSNQLWAEPSETPTSDVLSLDNPSSTGSSSEPGLMVSQINPFSTPRVSLSKSLSTAPERGATYDMYFSAFKVGKIQCKADTLHKEQQKKKKKFSFFLFLLLDVQVNKQVPQLHWMEIHTMLNWQKKWCLWCMQWKRTFTGHRNLAAWICT